MFLVLVALILRPVGFTYRGKLAEPRWRNGWDWALTVGGAVPALLFGVAFGNLFLGLPFHYDELQRPVFTGSFFTLLHPFALLAGIVSLAMLILHGSAYAAFKVGEPMSQRAAAVGRAAAVVFVVAFVIAGVWVGRLEGARIVAGADPFGPSNPLDKQVVLLPGVWLAHYGAFPVLWLLPALAVLGAAASWMCLGARHAVEVATEPAELRLDPLEFLLQLADLQEVLSGCLPVVGDDHWDLGPSEKVVDLQADRSIDDLIVRSDQDWQPQSLLM